MKIVVDASVAVKWLFADPAGEPDTDKASQLLQAIKDDRVDLMQPPHWLAEVIAVVTRLRPEIADTAIDLLDAMELSVQADAGIYKRASRIARQLGQHLFDTLYHAVALERDAVLITADERYLRKAGRLGGVVALKEWTAPLASGVRANPAGGVAQGAKQIGCSGRKRASDHGDRADRA